MTNESRVVMSCVCVEQRSVALSSTGRQLPSIRDVSGGINQMIVFEIIIILHCLSDCVLAYPRSCKCCGVCAWQAVHMRHMHNTVRSLGVAIIARSPILQLISPNRYEPYIICMNTHRWFFTQRAASSNKVGTSASSSQGTTVVGVSSARGF